VEPDKEKLKNATDHGYGFIAYSLDSVILQENLDSHKSGFEFREY